MNEDLDGEPGRVRRLGGRFAAMVLMPSRLALEVASPESNCIFFDVRTEGGQDAFRGGYLCFETRPGRVQRRLPLLRLIVRALRRHVGR